MLDAPWGRGKSYYITHELIPFLSKPENGNYRCVSISLYGLTSTAELSKAIYIELRIKPLFKSMNANVPKEISAGLSGLGKTVFRNLINVAGISLDISDKDLQELYHSLNLDHTLIILEDVERSCINLIELLGYLNGLAEQDNAKVLLVTNEEAILQYSSDEFSDKTNSFSPFLDGLSQEPEGKRHCTEESILYLQAKEKTISDTLSFDGDFSGAIKNIIQSFSDFPQQFQEAACIQEIAQLMDSCYCYNLRTFIYACQKTSDILEIIKDELSTFSQQATNISKQIFYSLILFAQHIKVPAYNNHHIATFPKWKESGFLSSSLSNAQYPLFRFCYDYIKYHTIDHEIVSLSLSSYHDYKLSSEHLNDDDLLILHNWYISPESEVRNALMRVEKRLDANDISFYEYGNLIAKWIIFHSLFGYDYSPCKNKMIQNIKTAPLSIRTDLIFSLVPSLEDPNQKKLMTEFIEEIMRAIRLFHDPAESFTYQPEDLNSYFTWLSENKSAVLRPHSPFISTFDLNKLVDMIFCCTAQQLHIFRSILALAYRRANADSFSAEEQKSLEELLTKITQRKSNFFFMDSIIKIQLEWLCQNLTDFIRQMSE